MWIFIYNSEVRQNHTCVLSWANQSTGLKAELSGIYVGWRATSSCGMTRVADMRK